MRSRRSLATALLAVTVPVAAAACGAAATSTDRGAPATAPATAAASATGAPGTTAVAVRKDVLAQQVDPPGAPGRTLTLIRYTIAPGAALAPHVHPGIQMAAIDSGTLTYTVESGTATVRRQGSDTTQAVTGPTTITLGPGDAVIETGDMVHFGANETTQPVVITATLLTDSTKDLAVTVTTR